MKLPEFLKLRERDVRLARLTHDIVLPEANGLEIGPGDAPLPLPEGFAVSYVEHETRSEAAALRPNSQHIVWSGAGPLATLCSRRDYDFVVAAQVAQYVPNLLGWFRGIFEILRVGGVLNLSLPDRRFTFDVVRHASTVGELLEAFYLDYQRPSLRQVFDHAHLARAATAEQLWDELVDLNRLAPLCGEHALSLAAEDLRQVKDKSTYIQCHSWVFTPLSFLDLIENASRLRLFSFVVSQFASTEPNSFEFFVSFRRDRETDPGKLLDLQIGAIDHVRSLSQRRMRIARSAARD